MRALHLTSGNMYGGVETFLATLARESAATPEMRSEFAVCFEGRFSQELAVLGCAPHVLGRARLSRPHSLVRARRGLASLLARESFDVVVCHQPWPCVVFGSVVRQAGFPLALWVHMASEGRHWLERLAGRTRPDLAICNSRFTASCVARWLRGARVEHVYCPVSSPSLSGGSTGRSALRRSVDTTNDEVVVVQVSRLEAWKGQKVLFEALSRLRELPGWTCWIVGGTQRATERAYLRDLTALARDGGITDRVRFLGERSDVPAVLRAADIFCQPNTSPEPFGISLVEALHAGLPVVTSGIGGAREIVDDTCGVLVAPGDAIELSSTLRRLMMDSTLTARLSAGARRRPDALCDPRRQMRRIHQVLASAAVA